MWGVGSKGGGWTAILEQTHEMTTKAVLRLEARRGHGQVMDIDGLHGVGTLEVEDLGCAGGPL